jgi:hypothetical protein
MSKPTYIPRDADDNYYEESEVPGRELSPIEEARNREQQELQDAIASFQGDSGAKIYVYRLDGPDNRSGEFIESFGINDYSHDELLQRLRDVHGGGRFKVQIRNRKGHLEVNQICSTIKKPVEKEPEKNNDFSTVLMSMQDTQRDIAQQSRDQMTNFMMMMQQQATEQAKSQTEMMIRMMEINNTKKESFGMKEMFELMLGFEKIKGKQSDPFDMFIKGMEMGQDSGGGDESTIQTLIKSLGAPLADLATKIPPQSGQPCANMIPQPAPILQHAPQLQPQQPQQPQTENDMLLFKLQQLKPYLDMMIQAAERGASPHTYAEMLCDQMDEKTLRELIGDEGMYNKLFTYAPQLGHLRDWFDNVRELVIEWMSESPTEDVPPNAPDLPPATPGTVSNTSFERGDDAASSD